MGHVFVTTCVGAVGDDINEMTQLADDIGTDELMEIAEKESFSAELLDMLGYEEWAASDGKASAKDLFLNDYSVSAGISLYQGVPAVYVKHSGIEHVFVPEEELQSIRNGDEAEARQEMVIELEEALEDDDKFQSARTPSEIKSAWLRFKAVHREQLDEYRIPLTSLFISHSSPEMIEARKLDNADSLYQRHGQPTMDDKAPSPPSP